MNPYKQEIERLRLALQHIDHEDGCSVNEISGSSYYCDCPKKALYKEPIKTDVVDAVLEAAEKLIFDLVSKCSKIDHRQETCFYCCFVRGGRFERAIEAYRNQKRVQL